MFLLGHAFRVCHLLRLRAVEDRLDESDADRRLECVNQGEHHLLDVVRAKVRKRRVLGRERSVECPWISILTFAPHTRHEVRVLARHITRAVVRRLKETVREIGDVRQTLERRVQVARVTQVCEPLWHLL